MPSAARLTSQKQQLNLSLQRLQSSTITPPTPPRQVPAVKALPPVSYSEHQAGIEKAKAAGSRSECLRQRLGGIGDRNQTAGNHLPQGTTHVKWLGQSADGSLSAEITLMIARER